MNKLHKVLANLPQLGSLLDLVEAGLTPADIKKAVIATLQPYFRNEDILKELAIGLLVPEALNLARLQQCPWAFNGFRRCLSLYHSAHAIADSKSLKSYASWERVIQEGLSQYWSAFQIQTSQSDLELDEFAFEAFRNIGMTIEAVIQPHLRDLLNQIKIIKRQPELKANLTSMSLGDVVVELEGKSELVELLAPPPWCIRLSQWRNIAQHHSFRVQGKTIICRYGRAPRVSEVCLLEHELKQVFDSIHNVFLALKLARTIYCVDNIEKMQAFISEDEPQMRVEQKILTFTSAVATQGFEVIDINLTDEIAVAILRDVTDQDPKKRRFHASQLVYPLWASTECSRVTIEYREKDGTCNFASTVLGKDCERLTQGNIDLEEFIKRAEFIDLKSGKKIVADNEV